MTDSSHELMNVRELAAMLRLSLATVYRLVESRLIPFYRFPRGLRFHRNDVDAYLARCRVESVETIYERKKVA